MNRLTKHFLIAMLAVLAVSLVWLVVLVAGGEGRAQSFANGGYDLLVPANPETGIKASQSMADQSSRAMFHLFVVTVLAGAVMTNLLFLNGSARPLLRWGSCGALALILYAEQWQATGHFLDYYSPAQLYADNAVLRKLRTDPGRPRVTLLTRAGFYNAWLSLLFPYYDIDSIDVPAASRPPADYLAFFNAVDKQPLRKWELCAVKYILGPEEAAVQAFKQQGWEKWLSVALEFDSRFGKQALFAYSRALPRALVLHRWEAIADQEKLLARLTDPQFDPHTTVLLDAAPALQADPSAPPASAADLVSFKPTRVSLKTSLKSPGILMLNDRYYEDWHVTVDGAPAPLLRANFIMRGVALEPGDHQVVFSFSVPASSRWITWGEWIAITAGLILTGLGALRKKLK